MKKIKILTASASRNAAETFDRLAEEVQMVMNNQTASVQWFQSPHGEYDVRLTAIITWFE